MYDRLCARCSRGCLNFCSSYTPLISETEPNTRRTLTVNNAPNSSLSRSPTLPYGTSTKPDGTGLSNTRTSCFPPAEATLCTRRQTYATTVYHVIWAGLSEDTLTIPFVEKKTRTVC